MKIYIDYFSHVALSRRVGQKYNGGDNGTKLLLHDIIHSDYCKQHQVYLILPKDFSASDEYETEIVDYELFIKIYTASLLEIDYFDDAILFIPVVCGREMIMVNQIKKKFPYLKVYGRIHDKNHNLPLDLQDRYYYSGFKRTGIPSVVDWIGKKIYFKLRYKQWISNFDKIFTVSNYSLQALKNRNIRFISYYYQGTLNCFGQVSFNVKDNEDFILFVNGGRPEKNSLRAIRAFLDFKDKHPNNSVKLYITSTKPETQNNLIRSIRRYNKKFILENIKFFEYISYQHLQQLFQQCKFLLFASKGEGFGIPILEAIENEKPVLASWTTSIPEVAGPAAFYIDPMNIKSIERGIEYFMDDTNLSYYKQLVKRRKALIAELVRFDTEILINEIFSE